MATNELAIPLNGHLSISLYAYMLGLDHNAKDVPFYGLLRRVHRLCSVECKATMHVGKRVVTFSEASDENDVLLLHVVARTSPSTAQTIGLEILPPQFSSSSRLLPLTRLNQISRGSRI